MKVIVGIDPGITGALACITPPHNSDWVVDLPVMAKGKGGAKIKNQINASALSELLKQAAGLNNRIVHNDVVVYLERTSAMPGQGVASMFSMGDSFGCIRGVVGALGLPLEIITPQKWKKYFNLPSDKEVCRAKAIELFPCAELSRKKDHNRAEALLIAQYGYDLNSKKEAF